MNTVFSEKLKDLTKSCAEPAAAIYELNTKTFNNLTKNNHFENLVNVKNPQEFLEAQRKFQIEMSSAAINYAQELSGVMMKATFNFVTQCNDLANELAQTGHETVKTGLDNIKSFKQGKK